MIWFIFALVCVMGWGFADLFYKKGAEGGGSNQTASGSSGGSGGGSGDDRYSHLKQAVWVGLVMGVCAFILLPFSETKFDIAALIKNAFLYSPASLCYIISMVIGYAGLRYLELSIVSPVQNASGAFSMIAMLIFFAVRGTFSKVWESIGTLDIIGTALITAALIALAIVEKRMDDALAANRKYRLGVKALAFPLLYCLFDTIGTAADGIILDEEAGLGLGEIDVIILYGLTFLLAGIIVWIFLYIKTKKVYNPFAKSEGAKAAGALCEQFGQIFYVYAMAANPVLAAPMVAGYCVISVLLSRIFLKEKLTKWQYACIFTVIAGILLLGISEGLAA